MTAQKIFVFFRKLLLLTFLLIILSCKKENFTQNDVEIEFYDFSDKNIETFF